MAKHPKNSRTRGAFNYALRDVERGVIVGLNALGGNIDTAVQTANKPVHRLPTGLSGPDHPSL